MSIQVRAKELALVQAPVGSALKMASLMHTSPPQDAARRDYVVLANSLLPLLDCGALIVASYWATMIYASGFGPHAVLNGFNWPYIATMLIGLSALILHDRRFISVASRGQSRALVRRHLTGCVMLSVGIAVVSIASGIVRTVPMGLIATWTVLAMVTTAFLRVLLASLVQQLVRMGMFTETVAIVGAGPRADVLVRHLQRSKPHHLSIVGVFDDQVPTLSIVGDSTTAIEVGSVSGSIEDLLAIGRRQRIDWVFLATQYADDDKAAATINRLKALSVPIAHYPQHLELGVACKRVDLVAQALPVTVLHEPSFGWQGKIKSIGQFLPRWIVTLATLLPVLIRAAIRTRWEKANEVAAISETNVNVVSIADAQRLRNEAMACALDDYNLTDFKEVAESFGHHRFGYVVTPNADHFIRLHDSPQFRDLYSTAEYILLDSRFLANIWRLVSGTELRVCTGSDLTTALFDGLKGSSERIVIIGGSDAQIEKLTSRYELQNVAHHNPPFGFIHDETAITACLRFVEAHSPFKYCFLAVGSPQQEVLAQRLKSRGAARGLALCVGASIDFLTGIERRAPLWIQRTGFEWLYRLSQNPARLAKRYLVRGPRIFWLLRKTRFVVRSQPVIEVTPARVA